MVTHSITAPGYCKNKGKQALFINSQMSSSLAVDFAGDYVFSALKFASWPLSGKQYEYINIAGIDLKVQQEILVRQRGLAISEL